MLVRVRSVFKFPGLDTHERPAFAATIADFAQAIAIEYPLLVHYDSVSCHQFTKLMLMTFL